MNLNLYSTMRGVGARVQQAVASGLYSFATTPPEFAGGFC